MAGSGVPSHRSMVIKVSVFAVVMLLVAAGLVVVFGDFRFGPTTVYHATFTDASRLKAGQKVRIAGVPVGSVKAVKLNPDHSIDVAFAIDRSYTLYSSTRAVIRYENLVGDRFLEITSGQVNCASCRRVAPSTWPTPSPHWISMRCWVGYGRC